MLPWDIGQFSGCFQHFIQLSTAYLIALDILLSVLTLYDIPKDMIRFSSKNQAENHWLFYILPESLRGRG